MRQLFLKHIGQTSPNPMIIDVDHAEGIYIYDRDGQRFADMTSGICVSALGHGHPVVTSAVLKQATSYFHTMVYGEHVQAPQVLLAKLLVDHLPPQLNSVYFTNSGSEATEGAIKLVRKFTGRAELIACTRGYHGSTIGAMSLMSEALYKQAYQPSLPGVRFIHFNDMDDLQIITDQTAGVIVEPVRGPAGVELADLAWLRALRQRCDETKTLLIFDEIQCGIGRTGRLFAFEHYAVVPDVLLLAKALGGGMPIGALIAGRDVMQQFSEDPILGYISTFGGHPVCCAAGHAALKHLIDQPELIREVRSKEKLIRSLLRANSIVEIRSKGLLMAVELGDADKVHRIVHRCHEKGVLVDHFLFCDTAFRIAPPLTISTVEIEEHISVIHEVILELG